MAVSANRLELLQIADAVAREKSIDRGIVITAMEDAIAKAARSRYGSETEVHAEIDPKTGELRLARHMLVVELVENPSNQISLEDARKRHPAAQLGDTIADTLPPLEYGRIAAQSAKQVIVQKVREAERDRQYEEYKDRIGDIVNGIVKRVEYGNVVVDLGRGEAIVRRDEMLPRETFRNGDRIRAFIYDVRREPRGPQIFLSRTHPQFMAKLFAQEVPEIYDGIVEVKAVARDPGSRAKIAVISRDSSVDPVGACVGMRGSRVQAVVNELQGEKIDIIPWTADPAIPASGGFWLNAAATVTTTGFNVTLNGGSLRISAGTMTIGTVPDPVCPSDGVLLRVLATGICGTDVRVFFNGDRRIEPPWVLGHEICGEVLEIGPEANGDLRAGTGDLVHVISTLYCGVCTLCRTGNEHLCQAGGLMGFDYQGAYAELVAVPTVSAPRRESWAGRSGARS
jgi:transcription termination factor NusA